MGDRATVDDLKQTFLYKDTIFWFIVVQRIDPPYERYQLNISQSHSGRLTSTPISDHSIIKFKEPLELCDFSQIVPKFAEMGFVPVQIDRFKFFTNN